MPAGPRPYRLGVSGCRRGGSLARELPRLDGLELVVAFDPDPAARERFAAEFRGVKLVPDFGALLDAGPDLVYLACPEQYHTPQAVAALGAGVHVLSEVPAAVSTEQAHELVGAVRRGPGRYMLAENYCFTADHLLVAAMARAGAFGELYFGEGDYLQDMRAIADRPGSWQRHWYLGRDAVTYPTHTLGPLLDWFGTRIVAVAAAGSGRHTPYAMENTLALTARTASGGLLRMRFDMLSPRPVERLYCGVQGTAGGYEAGRGGAPARVHLAGRSPDGEWEPLEAYRAAFPTDPGLPAARSGSPLRPAHAFVTALRRNDPVPIDVYRALDLTLPGLASEASIGTGGGWVPVPDPRHFTDGLGTDQAGSGGSSPPPG